METIQDLKERIAVIEKERTNGSSPEEKKEKETTMELLSKKVDLHNEELRKYRESLLQIIKKYLA